MCVCVWFSITQGSTAVLILGVKCNYHQAYEISLDTVFIFFITKTCIALQTHYGEYVNDILFPTLKIIFKFL